MAAPPTPVHRLVTGDIVLDRIDPARGGRVIVDLSVEPPRVQERFQELFALTSVALADEDETAESYFRSQPTAS